MTLLDVASVVMTDHVPSHQVSLKAASGIADLAAERPPGAPRRCAAAGAATACGAGANTFFRAALVASKTDAGAAVEDCARACARVDERWAGARGGAEPALWSATLGRRSSTIAT